MPDQPTYPVTAEGPKRPKRQDSPQLIALAGLIFCAVVSAASLVLHKDMSVYVFVPVAVVIVACILVGLVIPGIQDQKKKRRSEMRQPDPTPLQGEYRSPRGH